MRRIITRTALTLAMAGTLAMPAAAQSFGKLSGTVVDPSGVPQMGATIAVGHNGMLVGVGAQQLLTNEKGSFLAARAWRPAFTASA